MTSSARNFCVLAFAILFSSVPSARSQQPSPTSDAHTNYFSSEDLDKIVAEVKNEVKTNGKGSASHLLYSFPGYNVSVGARNQYGGAEIHKNQSDNFVILEGDITFVTGGSVPDAKEAADGEVHGAKVVDGQPQHLKKGDVFHILAGTPHQALVEPGHLCVYLIIKTRRPGS